MYIYINKLYTYIIYIYIIYIYALYIYTLHICIMYIQLNIIYIMYRRRYGRGSPNSLKRICQDFSSHFRKWMWICDDVLSSNFDQRLPEGQMVSQDVICDTCLTRSHGSCLKCLGTWKQQIWSGHGNCALAW